MSFLISGGTRDAAKRWRPSTGSLILLMAIALVSPALALGSNVAEPTSTANDLLRVAIANEKLSEKNQYFAWTDRLQKPRGSVTKLMVDTPKAFWLALSRSMTSL